VPPFRPDHRPGRGAAGDPAAAPPAAVTRTRWSPEPSRGAAAHDRRPPPSSRLGAPGAHPRPAVPDGAQTREPSTPATDDNPPDGFGDVQNPFDGLFGR